MVNRIKSFARPGRDVTGVDDQVALRVGPDDATFARPREISHRGTWLKGRPASLAIALATVRYRTRTSAEGGI